METFTHEKYPPCVKRLLVAAGYNKFVALAQISEDKLRTVEEHINNNRGLIFRMKCCYSNEYRQQETFRFLPGHRAAILAIGQHIEQMKKDSKLKSKPKVQPKLLTEDDLKMKLIDGLYKSLKKKIAFFQTMSFHCETSRNSR